LGVEQNLSAASVSPGAQDAGLTPITRLKPAVDWVFPEKSLRDQRGFGVEFQRCLPLLSRLQPGYWLSPASSAPGEKAAEQRLAMRSDPMRLAIPETRSANRWRGAAPARGQRAIAAHAAAMASGDEIVVAGALWRR
jgi:hypothetical protein